MRSISFFHNISNFLSTWIKNRPNYIETILHETRSLGYRCTKMINALGEASISEDFGCYCHCLYNNGFSNIFNCLNFNNAGSKG